MSTMRMPRASDLPHRRARRAIPLLALGLVGGAVACGPGLASAPPAEVELHRAAGTDVDPEYQPFTDAEIDGLVAFTRLYGYVRYFHPSDAALVADWDAIAVRGAALVERTSSGRDLTRNLTELFGAIAPTVTVYPTDGVRNQSPARPPGLLPPEPTASPVSIVAWQHDGLSVGGNRMYASKRIDDRPGHHNDPGTLAQVIDAGPYRGKHIKARAWVRVDRGGPRTRGSATPRLPEDLPAGAFFGVHVTLPGGLDGFVDLMEDRPILDRAWRSYEVQGDVDAEAETISIVLKLVGEGRAFIDDVSLEVTGPSSAGPIALANPGFEEGTPGEIPVGWVTRDEPEEARAKGAGLCPKPSMTPGYRVAASREGSFRGRASGSISTVPLPGEILAPPSETFHADLGAGVACEVPLTLYYRDGRTLPLTAWPRDWSKPTGPFAYDPRDRATRVAAVISAWSTLWTFYPYFEVVPVDWQHELRAALARAAVDHDERASLSTLRRMTAALRDGNAAVTLDRKDPDRTPLVPFDQWDRGLPILWAWEEDRLVITAVGHTPLEHTVRRGDVVTAIDGVPAREAIEATEREVSAATPAHARWEALRRMRLGPRDRSVVLTIQPRTDEAFTVRMPHDLPLTKPPWISEPHPGPLEEIEPGVVYADLDRLGEDGLDRALPALAAAKGIVFDLRAHASDMSLTAIRHLIDAPVETPRWNVPHITRPDREGMSYLASTWSITPAAPRFHARVAFISDARVAGHAETLLGIVERHKLGEIVGGATSGTNGSTNAVRVPGGFRIVFTATKVLKHDGSRHHGIGTRPTIPVTRTLDAIAAGSDELLVRALEAVSSSK